MSKTLYEKYQHEIDARLAELKKVKSTAESTSITGFKDHEYYENKLKYDQDRLKEVNLRLNYPIKEGIIHKDSKRLKYELKNRTTEDHLYNEVYKNKEYEMISLGYTLYDVKLIVEEIINSIIIYAMKRGSFDFRGVGKLVFVFKNQLAGLPIPYFRLIHPKRTNIYKRSYTFCIRIGLFRIITNKINENYKNNRKLDFKYDVE